MGYSWEVLGELESKTLASGGEIVDKYISSGNCTALRIGVRCLEDGGTVPTAANIHSKIGTINVVASPSIVGGNQVSLDADDIPPMLQMLNPWSRGDVQSSVYGTQTDNQYQHFQYYIPLSPDPYQSKFGYRDARLKVESTSTQTASDNYDITVEGLIHDDMPEFYVQCLLNSFTGATGDAKTDLKLPQGGMLMGAMVMGTTSLQDLTTSDAPSVRAVAVLKNNTQFKRQHTRCMLAERPRGVYMVGGTTVTVTGPDYMFYDVGWRKGQGIPIVDNNTFLEIVTASAHAVRAYPLVAMPSN
jgi:hypothetical protein